MTFLANLGFQRHAALVLAAAAMIALAWPVCRAGEPVVAGAMRPILAAAGRRGQHIGPLGWLFRDTAPVEPLPARRWPRGG